MDILKAILNTIFNLFLTKDETKSNWYNENGLTAQVLENKVSEIVPEVSEKPIVNYQYPVINKMVTSSWGWRKLPGMARRFHYGVDFSGRLNEYAFPVCQSIVTNIKFIDRDYPYIWSWTGQGWIKNQVPEGRGWTPWLELTSIYDNKVKFYYMHGESLVNLGDHITALNDPIYRIDNYGNSQGAHLHFGIKVNNEWVNPIAWLDKTLSEAV